MQCTHPPLHSHWVEKYPHVCPQAGQNSRHTPEMQWMEDDHFKASIFHEENLNSYDSSGQTQLVKKDKDRWMKSRYITRLAYEIEVKDTCDKT